jgi:hypothetical protein
VYRYAAVPAPAGLLLLMGVIGGGRRRG